MPTYDELQNVLTDLVGQLKRNVENVPEELLRTKYQRAYKALTDKIRKTGQMMVNVIFEEFMPLPIREDAADTSEYKKTLAAIEEREGQQGGVISQMQDALLKQQDIENFYDLTVKYWQVIYYEAWEPYFLRHCRWVGKPDERRIYCDLFRASWQPYPKYKKLGHWILQNGERAPVPSYYPEIGPDPMREEPRCLTSRQAIT